MGQKASIGAPPPSSADSNSSAAIIETVETFINLDESFGPEALAALPAAITEFAAATTLDAGLLAFSSRCGTLPSGNCNFYSFCLIFQSVAASANHIAFLDQT